MNVSIPSHRGQSAVAKNSLAASLLAMILGAGMILFIGFSHLEVVHNAAHDTRHSSAFPCH